MTSDGKVPGGQVDTALLQPDAAAPFGVRLDPDRVVRAFDDAWTPGSVVLVEGSDLVRADLASRVRVGRAGGHGSAPTRCETTDRIVGRLLEHVDRTTR